MDYYVTTRFEIYRKCLMIGKHLSQKSTVTYIDSIMSTIQNTEKNYSKIYFPKCPNT